MFAGHCSISVIGGVRPLFLCNKTARKRVISQRPSAAATQRHFSTARNDTAMRILPAFASFMLFAMPALADDFPFAGSWKITGTVHAPWEDPDNPIVSGNAEHYIGRTVTISKDSIQGADLMGCGQTEITVEPLPRVAIFEGGLATNPKDPAGPSDEVKARRLATELGFKAEPVPTLYQGCSELSLHYRDQDTLMFGLDNRIFTMKRQ